MAYGPDDLVPIRAVQHEIEASILVSRLEENGVEAVISGGLSGGFRAEAPQLVQVLVRAKDEAKARAILEEPVGGGESAG